MLLHLNRLYAFMLILSLVHCGSENGNKLRDLQVDVIDGNQESKQTRIGNDHSKVGASGDNRLDTLINFKMHQLRYPKIMNRKRRLINMSPILNPAGRTYLGHLAAATNDAYLKMQNYAATFLVVVTTPRSGKKVDLIPTTASYTQNPVKKKARGYPRRYNNYMDSKIVHEHRYRSIDTLKHEKETTSSNPSLEKLDTDDSLVITDNFKSRAKKSQKQENYHETGTTSTSTSKNFEVNIIDNMDQLLRVVHVNENTPQNLADITYTTKFSKQKTPETTQTPISTINKKSINISEPVKPINTAQVQTDSKLMPKKPNPYKWENQLMHEVKIKVREGQNCTGESCDKVMYPDEDVVVNDPLAGDCNVEPEDDGNKGGYDIPNKDELAVSNPNENCPPVKEEDESSTHHDETTTETSFNEGCSEDSEKKKTTCKTHPPPICDSKPGHKNKNEEEKTTTKKPEENICESNDDDDVDSECSESDGKSQHQPKCHETKEDKKIKKIKPKIRIRRQISGLLSDIVSSTPHYTIFKLANMNLSNSQLLSPAQLIPAHIDIPRSLDNGTSMHGLAGTTISSYNNVVSQPAPEHLIKKSIDKNALPVLIENLKVVDQKLAEAVEPLHCAQETLDNLSKAEFSTSSSCNSGTSDNVLSDISDAERSALQKLAYKIINCGGGKLKRSNGKPTLATTTDFIDRDNVIAKRGIDSSTDINYEVTANALEELKKVLIRSVGKDTALCSDKTTLKPSSVKIGTRSPNLDNTDKQIMPSSTDKILAYSVTDKTTSRTSTELLPTSSLITSQASSKQPEVSVIGVQNHAPKTNIVQDYDYENIETKEDRLNRLQRDLNVANELQQILDEIKADKPRGKRHVPNHHKNEEYAHNIRRNNEQPVNHKPVQSVKPISEKYSQPVKAVPDKPNQNKQQHPSNVIHNKDSDNAELMGDNRSLLRPKNKKKKKKNFWRRLFGKRAIDDRFLNHIPNFQLSALMEDGEDPSITTFNV